MPRKQKPRYYIAFGSNLNLSQMRYRCPNAKAVCGLTIPDTRLVFRGVADIEPAPGVTAPGGLWIITPDCEVALDVYEGVKGGLYRKETYPVELADGTLVDALVYRMNRTGYGAPPRHYLAGIRAGYNDFGLDEAVLNAAADWSRAAALLEPRETKRKAPAIGVTGA